MKGSGRSANISVGKVFAGRVLVVSALLAPSVVLAEQAVVVFEDASCDYFIADGPRGFYLLEWYGGHVPTEGDVIEGDIGSYGFKNVRYPRRSREGRVYVEDYLLSEDGVIKAWRDHCQ